AGRGALTIVVVPVAGVDGNTASGHEGAPANASQVIASARSAASHGGGHIFHVYAQVVTHGGQPGAIFAIAPGGDAAKVHLAAILIARHGLAGDVDQDLLIFDFGRDRADVFGVDGAEGAG